MNRIKNLTKDLFSIIKSREFITAAIVVLALGLVAHSYRFFRLDLNYDYLAEYYASNGNVVAHRIELGRFISPILYLIRGRINAPWIIGLFAFPYIILSVYLVSKFFGRNKTIDIVIIGSFMTVNLTLSVLISTFLHDFDADMLACLLAVCSAMIWKKSTKIFHYLLMIPLLVISMGLYQSYAAVCFALIFVYTMLDFLNNGFSKKSFVKLIYGFLSLIIAMLIYFGLANIICMLSKIPLESRMNAIELFTHDVFKNVLITYRDWADTLFVINTSYGKVFNIVLSILIIIPISVSFILLIFNKEIKIQTKLIIVLMAIMLPFATNYTEFLSGSYFSLVMFYPTTALILPFAYLFVTQERLFVGYNFKGFKTILTNSLVLLLMIHILCSSITSNTIYAKKETETLSTFAYMNRVVYAIETHENYVPGKTPVAILGGHKILDIQDGYDNLSYISGARTKSSLGSTYKCYYDAYFEYIIKTDINIVDDETLKEIAKDQEIIDLPNYPDSNAICYYNSSILVVKLGDSFF